MLFLILGIGFKFIGFKTDYNFAENFATIALLIIMFYGGFGTKWKMARPVFKEAALLASIGVITTAILTGFFVHLVFKLNILESMLLGSVVASTDFASVSSIL